MFFRFSNQKYQTIINFYLLNWLRSNYARNLTVSHRIRIDMLNNLLWINIEKQRNNYWSKKKPCIETVDSWAKSILHHIILTKNNLISQKTQKILYITDFLFDSGVVVCCYVCICIRFRFRRRRQQRITKLCESNYIFSNSFFVKKSVFNISFFFSPPFLTLDTMQFERVVVECSIDRAQTGFHDTTALLDLESLQTQLHSQHYKKQTFEIWIFTFNQAKPSNQSSLT